MSSEIRVVKGTVEITGELTPDILRTLTTRHRARTDVEVWRARIGSLDAFAELEGLERLALVNCRIADPGSIARLPSLRRLFLNQLVPSGGWGFLAELTQLEELSLLNIRGPLPLPSLADHLALAHVLVWACRGFDDAAALASAPALSELTCVATGIGLDNLEPLLSQASLRYLDVQLATVRDNTALDELLAAHDKSRHPEVPTD